MILALACDGNPPGDDTCAQASARRGELVCSQHVDDDETWRELSIPSPAIDRVREGKYLSPGTDDSPIATMLVNANLYALHSDFLADVYGDTYPTMDQATYSQWILDPDNDEILSGEINEFLDPDGTVSFGFTVWDNPADTAATIQFSEVLRVYEQLSEVFTLDALQFVPNSGNQRTAVDDWPPGYFPVRGVDYEVDFEAYTPGVAYGTVRLYDLTELEAATAAAEYGYQDILVLEEAPLDIERVVSGVITGSRQGTLSHINVRSAARGTPNCYVREALPAFATWEGQLVRLECTEEGLGVEPAELADAEAWWEQLRPEPADIPPPSWEDAPLLGLLEVDTDDSAGRLAAVSTYGSKGANLATLYQRIDEDWQLQGFVVPFHHYRAFMEAGTWEVDLGAGLETVSFADTLEVWLSDDSFLADAALRRERLEALQAAMEEAPIDEALLAALATRIEEVYGDTTTMVRFRSSSNAEDALSFSGAGLYDSTSACLADELDDDDTGPSRCDPEKSSERTLSRALRRVWGSLWGMVAYEERAWYGIDQGLVAMGVLVNTRSKNEQVNAVAFSGDPVAEDDRILVNAQIGSLDVVSADPDVVPEVVRVTVEDGEVVDIDREQGSSEVTGTVMTDAEVTDLALLFDEITTDYPIDAEVPPDSTLLLDTEWKVLADGRLVIKQVRPFVR